MYRRDINIMLLKLALFFMHTEADFFDIGFYASKQMWRR